MGPSGLLFSQIGYELHGPKRVLVRGEKNVFPDEPKCHICNDGKELWQGKLQHWGTKWGSDWWVADFSDFSKEGVFCFEVVDNASTAKNIYQTNTLIIGKNILWEKSWEAVALDQAEIRHKMAYKAEKADFKQLGWFDAGMLWQEANSHSAYLFGLCDIIEFQLERLDKSQHERLYAQIINGADYLVMLQDIAVDLGHKRGPLVHQAFDPNINPKFPMNELILPGDTAKAAAALARVASLLPETFKTKTDEYLSRSQDALQWLLDEADYSILPFWPTPHGVDKNFVPSKAIPTSDLSMAVWAAMELEHPQLFDLTNEWIKRQVSKDKAEDGIYGHFSLIGTSYPTEKAWWHGVGPEGMGYNNGQTFGHNLMPLICLLKRYPEHVDAPRWLDTVKNYAYGYLIPGCKANPFLLMPNGYYPEEGFIWFAGLWHGANAIYGNIGALAMEFAEIFSDTFFNEIAHANLQWIAGLNSGITKSSLKGSYFARKKIAEGMAMPCSMIHGIGTNHAGSWLNITGAICNGFATGKQFVWDLEPKQQYDGPHSFTDEDWITHAGAGSLVFVD